MRWINLALTAIFFGLGVFAELEDARALALGFGFASGMNAAAFVAQWARVGG